METEMMNNSATLIWFQPDADFCNLSVDCEEFSLNQKVATLNSEIASFV